MPRKIAVLVGSLRKGSYNRKMANALISLAPAHLQFDMIEIGTLPLYNEDLDNNPPAEWKSFRDQIRNHDGLLFVTPEYNRSIPGVLKNALDVGSRPYGKSVWEGKPAAVISVSPGAIGGFGANQHLRQTFVFLDVPVLQQPEAYIGQANTLFDEQGKLKNPETEKFLQKILTRYDQWLDTILAKK